MNITYTTGDLLNSNTQALVNTVNCDGYMGKGIAYQFKLRYPENNKDYIKACKNGELAIGKVHYFFENDKIIINFPTKNKWREKSKMEYIDKGLDSLIALINYIGIKSISIPPLGSGNGGLIWLEVKELIEKKFFNFENELDILIYEPSKDYIAKPIKEPKLSASALILMKFKKLLNKFTKIRLQKAVYFMTVFADDNYFEFKKHKYGPYDNSIDIISKNIKEFQNFHNVKDINKSYDILYNKIISDSVKLKLDKYSEFIEKSCNYLNTIKTDKEVECVATIVFLLQNKGSLNENDIIKEFNMWSEDKKNRFSKEEILQGIESLYKNNIIGKDLIGFRVI